MSMYKVQYGDMHIAKERAKMCYCFLKMPILFDPVVSIISKGAQAELKPGYMQSENMFAAQYGYDSAETFDEFWQVYRKQRVGITCMASFDEEDKIQVGMTMMPETYDINLKPENQIVITTYSPEADEKMDYFLASLYKLYDELNEKK